MSNVLLTVILLSGVVLLTRSCPLAAINCTAQYNLTIDDAIVINSTQYCHIDNCTVRIIETGDVLNIGTNYSDQYIIGCYNDTVTAILLEDDEIHDDYFCRPDQKMERESLISTTEHILDVIGVSVSLVVNVMITIIIISLKLYSRFLFRLLFASSILYVVVYTLVLIYELSEFAFKFTAPAGNMYCYFIINTKSTLAHCARFIEFEAILTVCYIFYKSSHCKFKKLMNPSGCVYT